MPLDGSWGSFFGRLVSAQVVSFLLFVPHMAKFTRFQTRNLFQWSRTDAVCLLVGVVLVGLCFMLAHQLIRVAGGPRLKHLSGHLFLLAFGAGVLANAGAGLSRLGESVDGVAAVSGVILQTAWLLLVAWVAYSWGRPSSKSVLRARQACQVLCPVFPLAALALLSLPTYPPAVDPSPGVPAVATTPAASSAADRGSIYVFVFDAWSYERTFREGHLRAEFINLSELARKSLVFHDAHSPGPDTERSMLGLLFSTDDPVSSDAHGFGFEKDGAFVSAQDYESLFALASSAGLRTHFSGFFLPYRWWLGDQVNVLQTYPWHKYYLGADVLTRTGLHLLKGTAYWTDPWTSFVRPRTDVLLSDTQARWVHRNMKRDVLDVLAGPSEQTFAVFHYPLPHFPYLWNTDGSYDQRWAGSWEDPDVEGYERNLAALDALIGTFMNTLKRTGRFEDATIVLTSDHTWNNDPDRWNGRIDTPSTHVPLLVKLPRQQHTKDVTVRFQTHELRRIVSDVLDGKIDPGQLVARIQPTKAEIETPSTLAGLVQ
ncbi:MAG: sulfatase-like hydrolase/transferase [Planctomycetes bacterium]|nr:sulfatase-like hydrolase/transferase [Planctomycetota bacterium]